MEVESGMGNYLNPDISNFLKVVNSDIYVDKTGLIEYTNKNMNTVQGYLCISRPRRFGKSITANMLAAYYGCDYDTKGKSSIDLQSVFGRKLHAVWKNWKLLEPDRDL